MGRERPSDRGVTSTVATVLVVAVVLVVAGTAWAALGGVGDVAEPAPEVTVEVESSNLGDGAPRNDAVTLVHTQGQTLDRGNLRVLVGDDEVFNQSLVPDTGGSGTVTTRLEGLVVEVDDDAWNDLNKPGTGPPGDPDGDSRNVVNEWNRTVGAGDRLVVQERADPRSYDVIDDGDRVRVVWTADDGRSYVLVDERL
jgi:flagellin-like protein